MSATLACAAACGEPSEAPGLDAADSGTQQSVLDSFVATVPLGEEPGQCERREHADGRVELSRVVRHDGVTVQVLRVTMSPSGQPLELYDARGDLRISHARTGPLTTVRIDLVTREAVVLDTPAPDGGTGRRLDVPAGAAMSAEALGNPELRLRELLEACSGVGARD